MEIKEIVNILEEDFSEVEVLKSNDELIFAKFYMDFDDAVLDAARDYANTESDHKEESEAWYSEYYIPYLYDYANDHVLEIVEEVIEEFDISGEFMAFQMDKSRLDFVQFMVMFTEDEGDTSIEELVKDYMS